MQLRKFEYLEEKAFEILRPSGSSVFRCHNPKGLNY